MRERDPEARRLLETLRRLEAEPWPDAQAAYDGALLALATRCETRAGKAELYWWGMVALGARLVHRDEDVAACRRDAFHELVATAPGLLLRVRAGLDPAKAPNLTSLLGYRITWRARELYQSMFRRHDRRRARGDRLAELAGPSGAADPALRVAAGRLWSRLAADESPPVRALALVAQGETVAEAARLTGASRQQVYRARAALTG